MIVDTSALLCVLLDEPDAAGLLEAIVDAPATRMSAANWLELAMVIEERGGRLASLRLDEFVRTAAIEVAAVTVEQATVARNAWRYFGRHKHSARLDFGDCFAYALAKTTGEKLLYAGEEFDRTDVEPALPARRAAGRLHHGPQTSPRESVGAPSRHGPDARASEAVRPYVSMAPEPNGPGAQGRDLSVAPGRGTSSTLGCEVFGAPDYDRPGTPGHDASGASGRDSLGAPGRDAPAPKDH